MPTRYNNAGGMGVAANSFTGIDESAGYHNLDLAVAVDAKNVDTTQGGFKPMPGFKPFPEVQAEGRVRYPSVHYNIVTLMSFYRRSIADEASRSVCVAATETGLYLWYEGLTHWYSVPLEGATEPAVFQSGKWSWVTYETVRGEEDAQETVDVLLLSNAKDGMYILYGDTLKIAPVDGEKLPKIDGVTVKFAHLSRHAERIWGAGVEEAPDTVYYSRPYDALDWTLALEPVTGEVLPEQSGGEISMPTWDGDRIIGMRRFANYLMIFKKNSAFYVKGMMAGEFMTGEAYGTDGLFAPNTIINDTAGLVYLSDEGLGYYNGDTVQMLDNDRLSSVFRNLGSVCAEKACGTIFRHVAYFAVPVKTVVPYTGEGVQTQLQYEEPDGNNMLVLYDMRRGCYMKRPDLPITSLLRYSDKVLFTMNEPEGVVYQFAGTTEGTWFTSTVLREHPIDVDWLSAWQDAGRKDVTKTAFTLYFTGIVTEAAQDISITIETERKAKTKVLHLTPDMRKMKLRIANRGRRWRLRIQAQSTVSWELGGGIQVDMETEPD